MKTTDILATGAHATSRIPDAVADAAADLYVLPFERLGMAEVLALLIAALRSRGWHGPAGDEVLQVVNDREPQPPEVEAARRRAAAIHEPWPKLLALARDQANLDAAEWRYTEDQGEALEARYVAAVRRFDGALTEHPSPDAVATGGKTLDLDAEPQPPRWVVPGLIERGFIHIVTGDTGSFKSGFREALMAAGLRGERFLGRPVHARRFMVIDAENPEHTIVSRWRALGIRNEHLSDVHLTDRAAGVELGTPRWNEWLAREVEAFRPDVVFVDSVARATAVAVLDNDSVTELYAKTITPLVDRFDLAFVLMHHERKSGASGDRSAAALGARQWVNQPDGHITLAPTGPYAETAVPGGGVVTKRRFALRVPKMRGGISNRPEHFEVRGRKDARGALLELMVGAPRALSPAEEIIAACDKPLGRGELAKAAGMRHDGQRFRGGLKEAIESGRLVQREDGLYERPAGS